MTRIDVLLGEGHVTPADVTGRVVIVVDVLRAATTVAIALANGARAVIPFEHVDEVAIRAKQFERREVRLGGERKMQRIAGFDLGNSPQEYVRSMVEGRVILFSTTNGTTALMATQGARQAFFAGFANLRATIAAARQATRDGTDATIICSGTERRVALEDTVCAGLLVRGLARARSGVELGDGAYVARVMSRKYDGKLHALANDAAHARALIAAGFDDDVRTSLQLDAVPLAVAYQDRQLVEHKRKAT